VLMTKVDLLSVLEYDLKRVGEDLAKLNTRAPLIMVSARTGEGIGEWIDWLHQQRSAVISQRGT